MMTAVEDQSDHIDLIFEAMVKYDALLDERNDLKRRARKEKFLQKYGDLVDENVVHTNLIQLKSDLERLIELLNNENVLKLHLCQNNANRSEQLTDDTVLVEMSQDTQMAFKESINLIKQLTGKEKSLFEEVKNFKKHEEALKNGNDFNYTILENITKLNRFLKMVSHPSA